MVNIVFVCHGNICRSPMAEFVMKDIVKKQGLEGQYRIISSATSTEEIGNDVHRGTIKKLMEKKIPVNSRAAIQLHKLDYQENDYLIGMDEDNVRRMKVILGGDPQHKIYRLLDFTNNPRDIADPWYTNDFDCTFKDVWEGCMALLAHLQDE